jgi:NADP-dependent 3-hydroxy acid dehydrogenase YdfG
MRRIKKDGADIVNVASTLGLKGYVDQAAYVSSKWAMRDHVAVLEAKKLGIPVYGICDSNANPDEFTLAIPANDDAVKSIELILGAIRSTLERASAKADDNQ